MYTLTFADDTVLESISRNGTNFVSSTEIDESIFTSEALASISIYNDEDESTETMTNCELVRFTHYDDFHGNTGWYFAFAEIPESVQEITDIQSALVDLYEAILEMGGE